jgi:hypothetical protein
MPPALLEGEPPLPLFRGELGAESELSLQAVVEQLGLQPLYLRCHRLDSRRVGRRLLQKRSQLSTGGDEALDIRTGCCALRLE